MKNSITTFEQALEKSGTEKEKAFFANAELVASTESDEVAYKKLKVIARALNTNDETGEVWTPNWNDSDQYKYFPWFEIEATEDKPAGVGFSFADYDGWYSGTFVGSRLCYETRELALYAGKQFAAEYKDFILIG